MRTNGDNLVSSVASALRWSVAGRLATQAIGWVSTVVVIRLLHPEDYGLMAMAGTVTSLAVVVNEMGLTTAIVQRREIQDDEVRALLGATILCNVAICLVLVLVAPWIASFFRAPQVSDLVRVLALQFPIYSIGIIHSSLLVRELKFKTRSTVEAVALLIGSLSTLAMALIGWGVWALAIGTLITISARSLGFTVLSPTTHWPTLRLARARSFMSFGGIVLLSRIVHWFYLRFNIFLIGRLYPADAVGLYSVARELATLPNAKFGNILNSVALASFSRIQDEDARVRHYLIQAIRMSALVTVPVFFGISALASEAIEVVLGRQWLAAAELVSVVALAAPLDPIGVMIAEVLKARGRVALALGNTIVILVISCPAVLIGNLWGIYGICVGWAMGYLLAFLVIIIRASPVTGVRLTDVGAGLIRPVTAAAIMYVIVEGLSASIGVQLAPSIRLAASAIVGGLTYVVVMLLIDRPLLRDAWNFARA